MDPGLFRDCALIGPFTLRSAGNYSLGSSASILPDGTPFIIDYGAALNASNVRLNNYGGGTIEIRNAGAGTGSYTFDLAGNGSLDINANCSATTIVTLQGNIDLINNASGITIVDDANYQEDSLTAAIMAAGDIDGFTLEESQKLILAASVGVLAGAATTSITIEAADGSKTRITATVDADGNRSAVVKDVTG